MPSKGLHFSFIYDNLSSNMELESRRKELSMPPLGEQDKRTPEQIAQAERETTARISEYVNIREGHFERSIFEVLLLCEIPLKTSATLARTMRNIHNKEWERNEDHETTEALHNTTIPITPVESRVERLGIASNSLAAEPTPLTPGELTKIKKDILRTRRTGDIVSGEALESLLNGQIPRLRVSPKRTRK